VRAVVLTVSDRVSAGAAEDLSGPSAAAALAELGFETEVVVVPDGVESVETALRRLVDEDVPLIVTTGGTGPAPRDLTPEGTLRVVGRRMPGLVEAMRHATFGVVPHGMLSRGIAGTAGRTLIVNLPGSVKAVTEGIEVIGPVLDHAIALLREVPTGH